MKKTNKLILVITLATLAIWFHASIIRAKPVKNKPTLEEIQIHRIGIHTEPVSTYFSKRQAILLKECPILLAHEQSHVRQQKTGAPKVTSPASSPAPNLEAKKVCIQLLNVLPHVITEEVGAEQD